MPQGSAGALPAAPLDAARLRAAVSLAPGRGGPGTMWSDIRVLGATGSTNADVLGAAGAGASEGLVIAAEEQTAGRGRLGRTWQTLRGSALTFSVLLRPRTVPQADRGWAPLLVGVAAVRALRQETGVDAKLKWPNDVLVGARKLAGILAEQSGDAIVVGIGVNVVGRGPDLPVATAISLEDAGVSGTDRTGLLAAILRQIEHWYSRWSEEAGDAEASGLRREYLSLSATLGRKVRVLLPADRVLSGKAVDVDAAGQLVVEGETGPVAVSAGEVVHVR